MEVSHYEMIGTALAFGAVFYFAIRQSGKRDLRLEAFAAAHGWTYRKSIEQESVDRLKLRFQGLGKSFDCREFKFFIPRNLIDLGMGLLYFDLQHDIVRYGKTGPYTDMAILGELKSFSAKSPGEVAHGTEGITSDDLARLLSGVSDRLPPALSAPSPTLGVRHIWIWDNQLAILTLRAGSEDQWSALAAFAKNLKTALESGN